MGKPSIVRVKHKGRVTNPSEFREERGRQGNALDVLIASAAVASAADKIISSDGDYEEIAKVSDLRVEILK